MSASADCAPVAEGMDDDVAHESTLDLLSGPSDQARAPSEASLRAWDLVDSDDELSGTTMVDSTHAPPERSDGDDSGDTHSDHCMDNSRADSGGSGGGGSGEQDS